MRSLASINQDNLEYIFREYWKINTPIRKQQHKWKKEQTYVADDSLYNGQYQIPGWILKFHAILSH
jgi:hypothetical protein